MSAILPTARESHNARMAQYGPGDYAPVDPDTTIEDAAERITESVDECIRFVAEVYPDEVDQLIGRLLADGLPNGPDTAHYDALYALLTSMQESMYEWALEQAEAQARRDAEDEAEARYEARADREDW